MCALKSENYDVNIPETCTALKREQNEIFTNSHGKYLQLYVVINEKIQDIIKIEHL